jgi:hypothetical protein
MDDADWFPRMILKNSQIRNQDPCQDGYQATIQGRRHVGTCKAAIRNQDQCQVGYRTTSQGIQRLAEDTSAPAKEPSAIKIRVKMDIKQRSKHDTLAPARQPSAIKISVNMDIKQRSKQMTRWHPQKRQIRIQHLAEDTSAPTKDPDLHLAPTQRTRWHLQKSYPHSAPRRGHVGTCKTARSAIRIRVKMDIKQRSKQMTRWHLQDSHPQSRSVSRWISSNDPSR